MFSRCARFSLFWSLDSKANHAVVQRSFASLCGGRKTEAQTQATCTKSKQLLYGCQMSRLLQDHDCVQPCSDSCSVCVMFHGAVPTHRRTGETNRRLLLQEETKLNSSSKNVTI